MVMEIPLSRGMVALIDDSDYELVSAVGKWYADRSCGTFYARKNFYRNGKYTFIKMHNLIMSERFVDHANGNGLDNQRGNLRIATSSQNAMNRGLRSDNTSGFKGVYWHRQSRAWVAAIVADNRKIHLGKFESPEAAAAAYDAAAIDMFGKFARLNFPLEQSA